MAAFAMNGNIMKSFFVTTLILICTTSALGSDQLITYQTRPATSTRDYSAPTWVTEGKLTYQTLPGSSSRDYKASIRVNEGNAIYQTLPGSSTRDYSAPTWTVEGNVTYQTRPGSSTRDYSAPRSLGGRRISADPILRVGRPNLAG
jgi:hypothetical protein